MPASIGDIPEYLRYFAENVQYRDNIPNLCICQDL